MEILIFEIDINSNYLDLWGESRLWHVICKCS